MLQVFTDGSALNNPGRAGWAFAFVDPTTKQIHAVNHGYYLSTNNRMEFAAFIYTLFFLKKYGFIKRRDSIEIHTDSNLLIQSYNNWIDVWAKKNFAERENVDLLKIIYLYKQHYKVKFVKVRAHSGIPMNERVDQLAKDATNLPEKYLLHDLNYERGTTKAP